MKARENRGKKLLLRVLSLLLCTALITGLWGCGGRELYERLLIHGIGVDTEGEDFIVTVRSSTSSEDEGEEYFKCRGSSVLEALNSLSLSTGRKPFYAHNYLVVFGKSCGEQGLDHCLDFFVRYYNTRPAVQIYLAEEKAEDILSFQKDGKYLKMGELQQLGDSGRDTGRTVGVELLDFVNGVKRQGSSPVLPVLRAEEDGVKIVSTAYFDGYRLQGFLSLDETRGYLAVKERLENGEVVLREEELGTVTLSLTGGTGETSWEIGKDAPKFLLRVRARGDVSAISGGRNRLEPEDYSTLERCFAEKLREEIEEAVKKAVLEDHCDIFGFGALLYREAPERWRDLSERWKEEMARCEYRVEVSAKVSRLED